MAKNKALTRIKNSAALLGVAVVPALANGGSVTRAGSRSSSVIAGGTSQRELVYHQQVGVEHQRSKMGFSHASQNTKSNETSSDSASNLDILEFLAENQLLSATGSSKGKLSGDLVIKEGAKEVLRAPNCTVLGSPATVTPSTETNCTMSGGTWNAPSNSPDATIATGSGVSEPVALPTTLNGSGNATNVYDFTVTNPSGSGGSFRMDDIVLNLGGTASGNYSKLRFSITGCGSTVSDVAPSGSTVTFSSVNATVADNNAVTCTVSAYWNDNTGITDNQTVTISMDANDDITTSNAVDSGGFSAVSAVTSNGNMATTVTATQLVFSAQPSSGEASANIGPITLQAQDAASNVDTDFTETITLTAEQQGGEVAGTGTLATTSNGNSLAVAASSGAVTWANLTYDTNEAINIQATSTSFGVESNNITIASPDATIATGSGVSEPVALATTLNGSGNAVGVYDFTVTNPSGGGGAFRMDNVTLNLSGTASGNFSKLRFSIDNCGGAGSAVADVTGGSTVTFTGVNATVSDNSSVTCTVSAYWNDNTGITDNQTVAISMDANDDITTSNATDNGGFSAVSALASGDMATTVTATTLAFTQQPSTSVNSGIAFAQQPTVTAQDAAGNTDTDYGSTITLTEGGAGALSDGDATVSLGATNGVAAFSGVLYTSNDDSDANFTITASDSSITDATSNSINPDVLADRLVFATEPSPTSIVSTVTTDFTTDPVVEARNALGQVDTDYSGTVVLSENGSGTVVFSALTDLDGDDQTVTAGSPSSGQVTFSDLTILYSNSGGGSENLNLVASDGSLTDGTSAQITSSVNNTPTISVDGTPTYNETGAVTLDGSVTIADGDGESDLQDGYISFAITGNNTANDSLTMVQSGSLALSGDDVQISSTTVGTLSASNGGVVSNNTVLQINFNSNITAAHAQTIAQAIQFDTAADDPGSNRTVTFTINDGIADGTDTATVTISALTADSTNAADFDTTDGSGLTTGLLFDGSDETLTISDATHITSSSAAVANGGSGTDTLVIAASVSADLTDANLTLSNFENLTLNDGATATLTESQHDTFSANAIAGGAATESIILDTPGGSTSGAVTGDADIESYTLNGAFTYTLPSGATTQNVTGSDAASQTIDIGTLTLASGAALDGGSGQTDILQMGTGSSIASATTITNFEQATITGSVTMTEAQHDGFSGGINASGGSDQITISAATDGLSADADVETYVLGAANSITLSAAGQSVTGSTGNDTVAVGALSATGTLGGGTGTDTLTLEDGGSISGANVTSFENLSFGISDTSVSIGATQLSQFSGTISAVSTIPSGDTINIVGNDDFTTLGTVDIETYSVPNVTTDSSDTRTITLGTGHTSGTITADSSDDAITFDIGTQTFAGTLTGAGSNDTVQMGNGSSIASATLNNVSNVTIASGGSVTMTEAQHDAFGSNFTASGTETITISAAGGTTNAEMTANSNVENYTLGAAINLTLTSGQSTGTITGSTGSDTVTVGTLTLGAGTINAGDGTDTLSLGNGANIVSSSTSNFENLTLDSGASVTMTTTQLTDVTGGTITAPGTSGSGETITIGNDGNFSTLNNAAIENYVAGDDSTNSRIITLGSNDTATNVSANASNDAVTFSVPGITYTGTLTGEGTTNDTVLLADSANISGGTLTNVEVLSIDSGGSVTISAGQYSAINSVEPVAPGTGVSGETLTVNGTGDITVNHTTIETYTIEDDSSESRTITLGGANSNEFTASSTTDAITLDIGGNDFSGSFTADATVANTVTASGTVDIASATLSGFTNLTLSGGTNNLTLTPAQLNAFSGTVTASGTDTLTFSATGTVTGGNLTAIETFATGTGGSITVTMSASDVNGKTLTATTSASDSFTINGSDDSQTINGSAGGDSLSGGNGADTINPGAGTDSMSGGNGNDTFAGGTSDLNGDTITDLEAGDSVVITGFNLSTSNVSFSADNGSLQVDTDGSTPLTGAEITITLSNSAGDNLNILNVTNDSAGTSTITFESSNDLATFSNLDGTVAVAYTENADAFVLDSDVTVFDTELDANSDNYSGSTLTISRNGGASANDVFSSDVTSLLSSLATGDLMYNGTDYGSVSNASGTLTLTFNQNTPSASIIASIMQLIQYNNSSEAPASSVTLDWVFNDGVGNSTVSTSTQTLLDITGVNDAPVLDTTQSPVLTTITEDAGDDDGDDADNDDDGSNNTNNPGTDIATIVVDSSITDPDGSAVESIAVTAVDNTNGVWRYSTDNGSSWNDFSATTGASASFESTARLLDGTLSGASTHKIRFVPSENYNGTATITFRAWDQSTGSAGGTADASTNGDTTPYSSASDTASITVTAVNDAPVVSTNTGVTVERGSSLVISSSALTTSDTEDSAANITYTVTQVPTLGTLQKSDGTNFSNMSVNDTFTQEDINNSRVQYVHAGSLSTPDTFNFSVADSDSSSLTGQQFSITIQDTTAPTITNISIGNSAHKVGDTVSATITVSSDSDDYTSGSGGISGTIAGYTLGSLSRTSDTQYTATFTISDGGTDVAAGSDVPVSVVLTDSTGNSASAFTTAISQASDAIYANRPEVILSVDQSSIVESAGVATVTASLTGSLNNMWPEDVGIDISFGGTATNTTDYNRSTSSLTISSETLNDTLTVTSVADSIYDALSNETVTVDINCIVTSNVSAASGQLLTITITDAQSAPTVTLSVDNTEIPEDGSSSATSTVTLSNATFEDVTVNLAYSGDATNTDDYQNTASTSVTITQGNTNANVSGPITAVQDSDSEGNESIVVDVDSVSGGGASEATEQQVTVTIVDDDNVSPTLDATQSPALTTIDEDVADASNTGTTIAGIVVDNSIDNGDTDQTTESIAVTNVDNTNGVWQFTTDNGVNWTAFSSTTGAAVDLTTNTTARLLSSSSTDNKIRFVPDENYNGSSTITFRAWDEATGTNGGTADVSTTGNGTAFSTNTDTASITVTSVNDAPSITSTADTTASEDSAYSYTVVATDPDDGDTITYSLTSGPDWVSINSGTGVLSGTPRNSDVGSDGVVVTATDEGGLTANQSFTIVISNSNDAPEITSSPVTSATSGEAYSYTLEVNDVDDNDTLSYTSSTLPGWLSFDDGTLSGTPSASDIGEQDVTLTVTDSGNASDSQSFTITVASGNSAPVIDQGESTSVNMSEDGSPDAFALILSATDDNGDALIWSVGDASLGSASVDSNGVVSYTPNADVNGADNFTVTVSDGSLTDEITVTVNIAAVNDAPVISGTPVTSVNIDTAYSFVPSASDVDSETLTFSISSEPSWASFNTATGALTGTPSGNDVGTSDSIVISVSDGDLLTSLAAFTITVVDPNVNVAPTVADVAATTDEDVAVEITLLGVDGNDDMLTYSVVDAPSNGEVGISGSVATYTPAADFNGEESFTYVANDGLLESVESATVTITLAPVNDAPTISGQPATQIAFGSEYTFEPEASDVEGDTLSFSQENLPSWLSLNSETGVISGTPTEDDLGTYEDIVITVSDDELSSSLEAFSIEVVDPAANNAPVAQDSTVSTDEDTQLTITLSATDEDGDSLTYSIEQQPAQGTIALDESQEEGNVYIYTPEENVGDVQDSLTFVANDGIDDSNVATITISIVAVNDAPVITGTPATTIRVGQEYSFTPEFSDIDSDSLTLSISNLPRWATFDEADGTISGTPGTSDVTTYSDVTIEVSDGELTDEIVFNIIVQENVPPEISGANQQQVQVGESYSFTPTVVNSDNDTLSFSIANAPAWASFQFDTASGEMTGQPTSDDIGVTSAISITVSDGISTATLDLSDITVCEVCDPEAPVIGGNPVTSIVEGQSYSFTPSSSDANNDIVSFDIVNQPSWADFDTTSGALSGVAVAGTYSDIQISVVDSTDLSSTLDAFTIVVTAINNPPVVTGTPPSEVDQNASYSFTPTSISDPEGETVEFTLRNNPTWLLVNRFSGSLSGTPGADDVGTTSGIELVASDGTNETIVGPFSITVNAFNTAPEFTNSAPRSSLSAGSAYSFTFSATDLDESDTLTFSVSGQPDWLSMDSTSGTLSGTAPSDFSGDTGDISVTVSDGSNTVSYPAFSISVNAVNSAPVASNVDRSGNEDSVILVAASVIDPDNDILTITTVSQPANGTLVELVGGWQYTPNSNFNGADTFTYEASDGSATSEVATVTVNVNPVNDDPNAQNDTLSDVQNADGSYVLDVLANDTDVDGDTLSISLITANLNNVTMGVNGSGQILLTASAQFTGNISFNYSISDGGDGSDSANVTFVVEPNDASTQPPVIAGIEDINIDANALQTTVNLGAVTATDASGNDVAVEITGSTATNITQRIFRPGSNTVTWSATDDFGNQTTAVQNVFVRPLVNFSEDESVEEGTEVSVVLTLNGDAVEYPYTVNYSVSGTADSQDHTLADGIVVFTDESITARTQQTLSFSVLQDDVSEADESIILTLASSDNPGESADMTITISEENQPPRIVATTGYSVTGNLGNNPGAGFGFFNNFNQVNVESGEALGYSLGAAGLVFLTTDATNTQTTVVINTLEVETFSWNVTWQRSPFPFFNPTFTATLTGSPSSYDFDALSSSIYFNTMPNGILNNLSNFGRFTANNFVGSLVFVPYAEIQRAFFGSFAPRSARSLVARVGQNEVDLITADSFTVDSDALQPLTNTANVRLTLDTADQTELAADTDSDGDQIPDSEEGFQDTDNDGIPDYLDAVNECNVLPHNVENQALFVGESDADVCLQLGDLVRANQIVGIRIDDANPVLTSEDPDITNVGGSFDFIMTDLPEAGVSPNIAIGQVSPIPANAVFRIYTEQSGEWRDFSVNDSNDLFSAAGAEGICPPPGSTLYTPGLTEGDWCVLLRIQDGGANDNDRNEDGAIFVTGGVGVALDNNLLPVAEDDTIDVAFNGSVTIDVLANDSDPDADELTVTRATGNFGSVIINPDSTLLYEPNNGYVGTDVVNYILSDGQGGTASANVNVTITANRAPGLLPDSVNIADTESIEIDVLANDVDVDGDALTITEASAEVGMVSVTDNNTLFYVPVLGFTGIDIVTYTVQDTAENSSSTTVSVMVDGNLAPLAENETVTTAFGTAITIDVLSNDSDPDGDTLTITAANVDRGEVRIEEGSLLFIPLDGFSGNATINYTISDGLLTADGTVTVTVLPGQETVTVTNNSSGGGGGAINSLWLLVCFMIAWRRRQLAAALLKVRR